MPYTQYTLAQFTSYIADILDDTNSVYWPVEEIQIATYEALRLWGCLTSYWRARGTFNLNPSQPYPYYDLSIQLPNLRTRSVTLQEIVKSIQYMLLENPSGIVGTGMSGQLLVQSILDSLQYARNRFIVDAHLPVSIVQPFGDPPAPQGTVSFDASTVYLHRTSWQDSTSTTWTNLWRQSEWSFDKSNYQWTTQAGQPIAYSESSLSPLQLQLYPPPLNAGSMDALTVESYEIDITNPNATFNMPDEWIYALKYAAISSILSGGMIENDFLGDYCEERYTQAVEFAKDARSILRVQCNGSPLSISPLAAIDAGSPYWRNQSGPPLQAGILFDTLVIAPGMPDQAYGLMCDVVQTAPIPPTPFDPTSWYIPIGPEDLDAIVGYVCHVLAFKCGGSDFKGTMIEYDTFMSAVARRKAINAAKIRYFEPLFGMAQKEEARRPDRSEVNA